MEILPVALVVWIAAIAHLDLILDNRVCSVRIGLVIWLSGCVVLRWVGCSRGTLDDRATHVETQKNH